jgi:hypothetical protein
MRTDVSVWRTSWMRFAATAARGTIERVNVSITTDIRIWMR